MSLSAPLRRTLLRRLVPASTPAARPLLRVQARSRAPLPAARLPSTPARWNSSSSSSSPPQPGETPSLGEPAASQEPPSVHVNGASVPLGKLSPEAQAALDRPPSYQLTFTCRPCRERSSHVITKQAFHRGTVLITCPRCKNRHVFADHLKIFGERPRGIEDILKENGEMARYQHVLPNGDVEILPPPQDETQ